MKILLPDDVALHLDLPDDELVWYTFGEEIPEEHRDADAIVMWGFGHEWIQATLPTLPRVRWIQTLAAGPDALLAAGVPDGIEITTGRGFHNRTVAEHRLMLTLALIRRLPACAAAQREHRWAGELGGSLPLHPAGEVTTLLDARVTVWGFGAIGQAIAELFVPFGAHVTGVARSAGTRGGFPVVAEDDIDSLLGHTDVLVMILPSTPATAGVLTPARLAALPERALVVNVGRASTWSEDGIVAALRDGVIAGAATDVVEHEPLPADSPLWEAPNMIITPHAAGGRPVNPEPTIVANRNALVSGDVTAMINRVQR
ncbi:MAG: NAD(P)-dependent oxidoreductase [Bowdeniella nasicola]|nr:NAD(P)-dependent oxidoreductase [Bowdeniella nasicola]